MAAQMFSLLALHQEGQFEYYAGSCRRTFSHSIVITICMQKSRFAVNWQSVSSAQINQVASTLEMDLLVISGDTLSYLALKFNSTVKAIQKANNMPESNTVIVVGQKLVIPTTKR